MFEIGFMSESIRPILEGLPATLELTFGAILMALAGGILMSFGVASKHRTVNLIFSVLNSFLKGIPILVILYLFNSSIDTIMTGLSEIFRFSYNIRKPPTFFFAMLAIAISYIPYMCDMIMSALESLPKGQQEACEAIGFTKWQTMRRILIPQITVIAIPNFGNHFVNLLKATSLTCMVTIMEMMGAARNFATMNQRFLEPYLVCALLYWAVFLIFEWLFRLLEKKTGRYLEPSLRPKTKKRFAFPIMEQQTKAKRNGKGSKFDSNEI